MQSPEEWIVVVILPLFLSQTQRIQIKQWILSDRLEDVDRERERESERTGEGEKHLYNRLMESTY